MAKATKTTKTGTRTKKAAAKKVKVAPVKRPETASPVDPFAQATPVPGAIKAPTGDNVHNAPSNDEELGNVAADIAAFAAAKIELDVAKARLEAISGTVMSFAKRMLLGRMVKDQSKAPNQKLIGDDDTIVTTFYQDRTVGMDGKNIGRYETLCDMFGKEIVDEQIAEFTGWTIANEKMKDVKLVDKMRKVLQAGLTAEELTGLFVAQHKSRKGVVEKAAELCGDDTEKMDQLLQLTVPKPTLKG